MSKDVLMALYDLTSEAPYLRWLYKILRWILKKKGLLKDYEDLYKTENSLRVFANSLKKIGVNIDDFIEDKKKLKIPFVFLFKRYTAHKEFLTDKLKEDGFKYFDKGIYSNYYRSLPICPLNQKGSGYRISAGSEKPGVNVGRSGPAEPRVCPGGGRAIIRRRLHHAGPCL